MTKSLGEPERVAEERKALNATLETLRKAIKVLQRDPEIAGSALGEDELEEQLKIDSMQRKRDEEQKKINGGGAASGQSFRDPNMGGPRNPGMGGGGGMGGNPGMSGNPAMGGNPGGAGMIRPQQPVRPPGGVMPPGGGGGPNTGNLYGDPLAKK